MLTIHEILTKYKHSRYLRYLLCLSVVILLYLFYKFYAWCNTESSDNAYIDADISNISAQVSGVITNILVSDNTHVKSGDLIAEIDNTEYLANVAKAEADIIAAEENIKITAQRILIEKLNLEKNKTLLGLAKATLDIAKVDYNRTLELNQGSFASQKLLDTAKVTFEKAKSDLIQTSLNIETSEKNLILLESQELAAKAILAGLVQALNLAKRSFGNTKITAPIDGTFTNSGLGIGNFVRPGFVLFSIVPYDKLYIKVNFKETQVRKLKPGMNAIIRIDGLPGEQFQGKIRSLYPATGATFALLPPDNATGNFTKIVQRIPVIVDFVNYGKSKALLIPGMSAFISVRTDQ